MRAALRKRRSGSLALRPGLLMGSGQSTWPSQQRLWLGQLLAQKTSQPYHCEPSASQVRPRVEILKAGVWPTVRLHFGETSEVKLFARAHRFWKCRREEGG